MPRADLSILFPRLYRGATAIAALGLPVWLQTRVRAGKEDRARVRERYGIPGRARPPGPLVWCHAASVGEALTLLDLITALERKGLAVLVTTGTVTSAALMAERLPARALHQYAPLDHIPWVRRFLAHWQPAAVIWSESELWPNTLMEIARQRLPAVLVNGRLSDRAFAGWTRWPAFSRRVLAGFAHVLAQSHEDARRFAALGARDVRSVGNLKLAISPLPADPGALADLNALLGARPRWLAASIHPGEDSAVAEAHRALRARYPDLLSVIVPRHPPKADAMEATCRAAGLRVGRRSRGDGLDPAIDVYIGDTVGELGLFYRACDLVFMGKSLAVGGGQNPAEPAKLGSALILGPDMSNFRDLTAMLLTADAAVQVTSQEGLTAALDRLLQDPAARAQLARNAADVMAAEGEALTATMAVLEPLLAGRVDCA